MADGGQHPAHLTVPALVNGQLHFADPAAVHVFFAAQETDVFRRAGQAVLQHDSFSQTRQGIGIGDALHLRPVGFGDMVARVRELEQEVAVIREKNQPVAVGIQAAHRPQHRLAPDVHQVRHKPPGMRVRAGRDHAARLVQGKVVALPGGAHDPPVELDLIRLQVHLCPQLGHDLTVNADAALGDPLLARPPGPDPGGGERFLQSLGHRLSSLLRSPATKPPAPQIFSTPYARWFWSFG